MGKEGPTLWLGSCGPPRCPPPTAAPRTFNTCFLSQAVCHGHARASPPRCCCCGSTALARQPWLDIPSPLPAPPRAPHETVARRASVRLFEVRGPPPLKRKPQQSAIASEKPPFSSFWRRFLDESFFALSLERQAGHSSLSHGWLLHRSLFCQPSFWPLLFKTLN